MEKYELEKRFRYVRPRPHVIGNFELIRAKALDFALEINRICPEGRTKSLALTSLEEAVMWANASIARDETVIITNREEFLK